MKSGNQIVEKESLLLLHKVERLLRNHDGNGNNDDKVNHEDDNKNNNDDSEKEASSFSTSTSASASFLQQTCQERYLTCCCCLLLYIGQLQEDQQQKQQRKEYIHGQRRFLKVMKDFPRLKTFIRELVMIDTYSNTTTITTTTTTTTTTTRHGKSEEDDNDYENVTSKMNILYQRMGIRLMLHYYEIIHDGQQKVIENQNNDDHHDWNINEWKEDITMIHHSLSTLSVVIQKQPQQPLTKQQMQQERYGDKQEIQDICIDTIDSKIDDEEPLLLIMELVKLSSLLIQCYVCVNGGDNEVELICAQQSLRQIREIITSLPKIIFEYYYYYFQNHHHHHQQQQQQQQQQQNDGKQSSTMSSPEKGKENHGNNSNNNNPKGMMMHVIEPIVNWNKYNQTEYGANNMQDQYELAMIQCFKFIIEFIQTTTTTTTSITVASNISAQQQENHPFLNRAVGLQMIECMTRAVDTSDEDETKKSKTKTSIQLLLNLSFLSLIHHDVTNDSSVDGDWVMTQSLSSKTSSNVGYESAVMDNEVAKKIQALILYNLSSILDYTTDFRIDDKNDKLIVMKIRSLTLDLLSSINARCGLEWLCNDIGNKAGFKSTLVGEHSVFCTVLRLVVGELRLVMGQFIDVDYKLESSAEYKKSKVENEVVNVVLEAIQYCIETGIQVLQVMLKLASDMDTDCNAETSVESLNTLPVQISFNLNFSADAHLHIKHSLDDLLDSTVQFILHNSVTLDQQWEYGVYQCCRYLGCYLSEVNVFEYDDGTDSILEADDNDALQSHDAQKSVAENEPHAAKRKLNTHHLLMAIRKLQYNQQYGIAMSKMNMAILCSSISVILSSWSTKRHILLIRKYIFGNDRDDGLISFVCFLLKQTSDSFKYCDNLTENDDTALTLFWCNRVIESLFDFFISSISTGEPYITTKSGLCVEDHNRIENIVNSMLDLMKNIIPIEGDSNGNSEQVSRNNRLNGMMQNIILIKEHMSHDALEKINEGLAPFSMLM